MDLMASILHGGLYFKFFDFQIFLEKIRSSSESVPTSLSGDGLKSTPVAGACVSARRGPLPALSLL